MNISKKRIFSIFIIFTLIVVSSFADSNIAYTPAMRLNLKYYVPQTANTITKTTPKTKPTRPGLLQEPFIINKVKSRLGNNYYQVDVSYKSITPETHEIVSAGTDGLFVTRDSKGHIQDVITVEAKTGNAMSKPSGPILENGVYLNQGSKKYLIRNIDKVLEQKNSKLERLNSVADHTNRTTNKLNSTKNEITELTKQIQELNEIKAKIQNGQYESRFAEIKMNSEGKIEYTEYKVMEEKFPNGSEIKRSAKEGFELETIYSETMSVEEYAQALRDEGMSESDIQRCLKQLKKDNQNFDPNKKNTSKNQKKAAILDDKKQSADKSSSKKIAAASQNLKASKMERLGTIVSKNLKYGFAIWSIISLGKSFYRWLNRDISTCDFIFESISNSTMIISSFITVLGPYLAPIFIAIDVVKNFYYMFNGKIDRTTFWINVTSTTIATITATLVSNAVGAAITSALSAAGTSTVLSAWSGPIAAAVALTTFVITFAATLFIVKFSGRKIVEHFQAVKKPVQFKEYCSTIRVACRI